MRYTVGISNAKPSKYETARSEVNCTALLGHGADPFRVVRE